MENISIQKLGTADVELAKGLFEVFLLFQHEEGLPLPPLASEAHFKALLERDDFHAIAALREGRVVGGLTAYEMAMFQEEASELFIYDVAVEAAHRRLGVASTLLEFTQGLCRERGIRAFFVGAMADEPGAVRFYESTGLKRHDVAWFVQEFGEENES